MRPGGLVSGDNIFTKLDPLKLGKKNKKRAQGYNTKTTKSRLNR